MEEQDIKGISRYPSIAEALGMLTGVEVDKAGA